MRARRYFDRSYRILKDRTKQNHFFRTSVITPVVTATILVVAGIPAYATDATISTIAITETLSDPTVTITGSNLLLTNPIYNGDGGSNYTSFEWDDVTANWSAGDTSDNMGITTSVDTSSELMFTFDSQYVKDGELAQGNMITVTINGTRVSATVSFTGDSYSNVPLVASGGYWAPRAFSQVTWASSDTVAHAKATWSL